MADLLPLYREIEDRCTAIARQRPEWPCHRGCSTCCRQLAEPLWLVPAEWRRIEEGLSTLDPEEKATVLARLEEASTWREGHLECPFLDPSKGICRIYDHRPAACRTYGFYMDLDGGRFCHKIAEELAEAEVTWGHQPSIDRRLRATHGLPIALAEWFESWHDDPHPPDAEQEPGTSRIDAKQEPGTSRIDAKQEPGTSRTEAKQEPGTSRATRKKPLLDV